MAKILKKKIKIKKLKIPTKKIRFSKPVEGYALRPTYFPENVSSDKILNWKQ